VRQDQNVKTLLTEPGRVSVSGVASPAMVAFALGVVYVVWGSTYLAIRVMVRDLPTLASACWRYLAAAIVLAVILSFRGGWRRLAAGPRELAGCATLGLLLPALGNGLVSVGEASGAPSGIAALLVAAVPLWIIVYRLVTGDRPGRRTVAGVLLGFAGLVGLIVASGVGGDVRVIPCLVIVVATLAWSFGSWSMPRLPLPADPFVTAVYEMAFGAVALAVFAVISGESLRPQGGSTQSWLAWGYLVVFGSVVAFTAYVWVLDAAPISLVATYAYVNPVVAVFLGWLILSETVTLSIVLGGLVAIVGVAIVVAAERRPAAHAEPAVQTEPTA
jgi:drug/metabolite transporter (DMT)-like permease